LPNPPCVHDHRHRARQAAKQEQQEPDPDPDFSWLPTSGPIGRFGSKGLMFSFYVSQLLLMFNPFQIVQAFRQIAGNTAKERQGVRLLRTGQVETGRAKNRHGHVSYLDTVGLMGDPKIS
jgi:hypothetical protein